MVNLCVSFCVIDLLCMSLTIENFLSIPNKWYQIEVEITWIHRRNRRNHAMIGVPPLQNLGKGDQSATCRRIRERSVTGFTVAVVVALLGKGEQSSRICFAIVFFFFFLDSLL